MNKLVEKVDSLTEPLPKKPSKKKTSTISTDSEINIKYFSEIESIKHKEFKKFIKKLSMLEKKVKNLQDQLSDDDKQDD